MVEPIRFVKPQRTVDRVFIHCSASPNPNHTIDTVRQWHRERGWSDIGYHYFIPFSGELQEGRNINLKPIAQAGNNTGTIAICLHGLYPHNFTLIQFDTLMRVATQINNAYDGHVTFHGHCEVSTKSCPVFDYKKILELTPDGHLGGNGSTKQHVFDMFDIGMGVVRLQKRLNIFLANDVPVAAKLEPDGIFGQHTAQVVLAFQKKYGLTVDGIAGPQTLMALPPLKESQ